jgi:hypothetical protein
MQARHGEGAGSRLGLEESGNMGKGSRLKDIPTDQTQAEQEGQPGKGAFFLGCEPEQHGN